MKRIHGLNWSLLLHQWWNGKRWGDKRREDTVRMLVNDILSISVWNIKARKIRFHCGLKWNILSISMCILSLYFCVCIISVHLFQVWLLKRCRGLDCVPCFLRGKLWRFLFSGFFSAWYHYWFCVVYIAAACIPCLLWEHSHQPMLSRQINIVRS